MALLHLRNHDCEATHFAEQEDIHLRMVSTAKDKCADPRVARWRAGWADLR
jgi:hypothetical protein